MLAAADLVVPEAAANLVRAVLVAAVAESNDPVALVAVVVIDLASPVPAETDLEFLAVAASGRADLVRGIGPVALVTEIDPADREMEIALVDQAMAIDPAVPVKAAAVSSGGPAIGQIVPGVPAIDPIGPTVPIGRIADPIGTNGRIGVAIVGRT